MRRKRKKERRTNERDRGRNTRGRAGSADGSDINSVDRSHSETLIATADDFGKVKLFRYPCVTENSKFKEFHGHSSHVTNVRWTKDDHLVSVGGNDKCVFVWAPSEN